MTTRAVLKIGKTKLIFWTSKQYFGRDDFYKQQWESKIIWKFNKNVLFETVLFNLYHGLLMHTGCPICWPPHCSTVVDTMTQSENIAVQRMLWWPMPKYREPMSNSKIIKLVDTMTQSEMLISNTSLIWLESLRLLMVEVNLLSSCVLLSYIMGPSGPIFRNGRNHICPFFFVYPCYSLWLNHWIF